MHPKQSRHEPGIQLVPVLGAHYRIQPHLKPARLLARLAPGDLSAKVDEKRLDFHAAGDKLFVQ